jgi:chaperonin GroES
MALKLRPLGDRVVVEPVEREETFAGGALVMPRLDDSGKRVAMEVSVGDKVLYAKYSGTEIKIENKKVLILKETDILAVVE